MKKLVLVLAMALGVMSCKKEDKQACECREKVVSGPMSFGQPIGGTTSYTDYTEQDCANNGKETYKETEFNWQRRTTECK